MRLLIHDTEVEPGAKARVCIPIAVLPTGTRIDMPLHVFRGAEPGPTLLVQAALHGDELVGTEVLRRMLVRGQFNPTHGAVLVVPVLNIFGFLHISRDVPDGKDVNRSFPGRARGSLASRVAWTVTHTLLPHADVAVDLHTGGGRRYNHPQTRYTPDDPESERLAEVFGAPVRFASKLIPKSFRQAAFKRGVPVVVYEGGESLRLCERAIEQGVAGVQRVMVDLGMGGDPPPVGAAEHLERTRWVRAPRGGILRLRVSTGQRVARGELLGEVSDPDGAHLKRIKAPRDGVVITLSHLPVVHRGDAIARIGSAE